MNLSGFVTVNGTRVAVNWSIDGNSITDGPGLSSHEIIVTGNDAPLEEVVEEVVYSDGYEEKTVTELRNLLSQREEPVYGNKEQLITRLRNWEENNPHTASLLEPSSESGDEDVGGVQDNLGDELNGQSE